MKIFYSKKSALVSKLRLKNYQGFSLVEVIIALGIVGLLLTGFFGVFGSAQRNISRAISVKEANILKGALETEMSILRSIDEENNGYTTSFQKAFDMVYSSPDPNLTTLVYQYKAAPSSVESGILPAYNSEGGIAGQDFITQIAIRKLGAKATEGLLRDELEPGVVVGNVYAVKMRQLFPSETDFNILELQPEAEKEDEPVPLIYFTQDLTRTSTTSSDSFGDPHLIFQAEFFQLPSNSSSFVLDGGWDFSSMGAPVARINAAIRR